MNAIGAKQWLLRTKQALKMDWFFRKFELQGIQNI